MGFITNRDLGDEDEVTVNYGMLFAVEPRLRDLAISIDAIRKAVDPSDPVHDIGNGAFRVGYITISVPSELYHGSLIRLADEYLDWHDNLDVEDYYERDYNDAEAEEH